MTDRIDFGGQPWQAIPRDTLRDTRLTAKAKGGLVTLLSHEEGWVRSCIGTLRRECNVGRAQAQAIMKELRDFGYADLIHQRDEAGELHTRYVVRAISTSSGAGSVEMPVAGEPTGTDTLPDGNRAAVVEPLDVEPLDVEPQNNQKLAPTPSTRQPDLIFETLFSLETAQIYSPEAAKVLTPSARAALNKAVAEVKATGIDSGELMAAIGAWGLVMGDATCTANAVAKHLPRLIAAANGAVARSRKPSAEDEVLAELARRREMKEATGG